MFLEELFPMINGFSLSKEICDASFNTGSYGFNFPSAGNVLSINTNCIDETQVDDTVIVNPTLNYADNHINITGLCIAPNLIRYTAQNIGNNGTDPGPQDIITTTLGF